MRAVAVVGLGRAGRARVRELEGHPRAALVCAVRRTPDATRGERHLYQVVEDPRIDTVFVCTPNRLHVEVTRTCLEARKHVCVDYPLAEGPGEARALFSLAERVGRVLHVEHIELLSPSQQVQRDRARSLGRPEGGELSFRAPDKGWIGESALAGSPALRAVARLHRLVDLFGRVDAVEPNVRERPEGGYRLEVDLVFGDGGRTRLVEERGPGLERGTDWSIRCQNGRLTSPPQSPAGPLFRRDLDHFLDRIEKGVAPYVSEGRVLHVLDLVERIDLLAVGC